PAPQQQFKFFFAPYEVRQAARVQSLKATFHRTRSQCCPGTHTSSDALEVLCSEVVELEQIANEPSGAFGNHDAVWLCNALQACRKVWRLTHDCLLLRSARPDQITDNHKPRRDAHSSLQGRMGLEAGHCGDKLQPRAYSSLRVVLMRLGITEID